MNQKDYKEIAGIISNNHVNNFIVKDIANELADYFEREETFDLKMNNKEEIKEMEKEVEEVVYLTINSLRHLNRGDDSYSENVKIIPPKINKFNRTTFLKDCGVD